jgi:hypothetical protein
MTRIETTQVHGNKVNIGFTIYLVILIYAVFHLSSFIDVKNYCNKLGQAVNKFPVVKMDALGSVCWLYKDGALTSVDQELQMLKEKK